MKRNNQLTLTTTEENLTPQQIVSELDKYIISQNKAKRSVAIALRNRWRRMNSDDEIRDEIMPNNILLIGPTGVGKTEIARRLARLAKAPFIKVEASKFTEIGYVGRDVESMIRDLADIAVNMVKVEMQERVKDKAKKLVEERILDILIPPVTDKSKQNDAGFQSNNGDFDPDKASNKELNERTRAKFRKKLRNGELEDREIEINVSSNKAPMMQIFGPQGGMDEMGINLQDMMGKMGGNNKSTKHVTVEEARDILFDEESEKLIDQDRAVDEALERVQSQGIVFIDEIDKVADGSSAGGKGGPDVSRQGVQRDMLPIIEGSTVTTKHGMVQTDHILFIGSGAFHVSKPSDLIPELQGRMPIRVELNSLTEDDFFDILTKPKNALTKQYQAMLQSEGVSIDFTEGAIKEIASIAAQVNERVENIGARRLHTILSTLLDELLFAVPDDIKSGEITIDRDYVNQQLDDLVKDKDLSHYIL